jgi:hypothetical protein
VLPYSGNLFVGANVSLAQTSFLFAGVAAVVAIAVGVGALGLALV